MGILLPAPLAAVRVRLDFIRQCLLVRAVLVRGLLRRLSLFFTLVPGVSMLSGAGIVGVVLLVVGSGVGGKGGERCLFGTPICLELGHIDLNREVVSLSIAQVHGWCAR